MPAAEAACFFRKFIFGGCFVAEGSKGGKEIENVRNSTKPYVLGKSNPTSLVFHKNLEKDLSKSFEMRISPAPQIPMYMYTTEFKMYTEKLG